MNRRTFFKSLGAIFVSQYVPITLDIQEPLPNWMYGIPYHQSNGTTGTWLGISRAVVPEFSSKHLDKFFDRDVLINNCMEVNRLMIWDKHEING